MKIFIVGCAKTGTTLLQRCFAAFGKIHLFWGEMPLDEFVAIDQQMPTLIAKRNLNTIFSNELPPEEIDRQLKIVKDNDVKLICMTRNREDTLKSDNGWVVPFRYDASMEHLQKYGDYIMWHVDYEMLVSYPDEVQKLLATRFNLKSLHKFSEYPDFVPLEAFQWTDNERYRPRRIGEAV